MSLYSIAHFNSCQKIAVALRGGYDPDLQLVVSALIVALNELLNNAQVAATETDTYTG